MSTSITSNKLRYGSSDWLNLDDGNIADVRAVDNGGIQFPFGTTAQRPTSPETGDTRWNTDTTVLEVYNGSSWIAVGALDGSSAALAAPSAEYLYNVAGIRTNGTYWVSPGGTAEQIYCDMTSDGGGWMAVASHSTTNWFAGNTGNLVSWSPNSLNYSYGTYSTTGQVGQYWKNYYGWDVTDMMLKTGNGTYWIAFPLSYIQTSSSYVSFSSGVRTSNNFPSNQYNANTSVAVMHRNGQPEDPWINAGNEHGNGGDASGTDYMLWGENNLSLDSSNHGSFCAANGSSIMYVR
jgi:hypothetical protein